jgi:hypothetical protein
VTRSGKPPDEPGAHRQAGSPQVPAQRPEIEDLRELHEPYDLPIPDYSDFLPPRLPPNAIVIDQPRGWQPDAPPSLAELLESIRTREPEPDLEAEP